MPSEIDWNQLEIVCLLLKDGTFSDFLPSEIFLKPYSDPLRCISYITTTECRQIYLIVSDTVDETVLKILHKLRQIVAIYLLRSQIKQIELAKYYAKLSGIFDDKKELCIKLLNDIHTLSIYSATTTLASRHPPGPLEYSTTLLFIKSKSFEQLPLDKLNNEQAKFIWFQFLIRAIVHLPEQTNNNYEKLLATCRTQFESDTQELNTINTIQNYYTSRKAIWWYTHKYTFLRHTLNDALCSYNFDIIFQFRYYIRDLYKQLIELRSLSIATSLLRTVFHSQTMNKHELEHLNDHIGELLSVNIFMYATISREIALSYVTNSNDGNNSSMETVLFEIELDETVESFVNIQNVSFLEQDGEYLFLIGTIFQLESCRMLPSTIWHIKLKLTNREEDEAKQLINHFENLFDEKFTVFTLGMFWLETSLIEKYDNALNYYNMLLNEYTTDNAKISIYTNIALIYDRKGDKDKINTRNYYEEALALAKDHESLSPEPDTQTEILEVILKRPVLNSTSLSIYYYNLGCIMFEKKNFENALENFEKANKQFSVEKLDPIVQADILNNIGCVYFRRNEYEISMRYFEQAFDIGLKIPEENRSAVITDYLSNMSAATIKQ